VYSVEPARSHASEEIKGVKSGEGHAVKDELCDARRAAGGARYSGLQN
jgi:hypothetical protein